MKDHPNLDFSQSCIGHDECYTTGGSSKSGCDNEFMFSMISVCAQGESSDVIGACKSFAQTYYDGVVNFGQGAFDADQKAVQCNRLGRAYADPKNHCGI